LEEVRLLVVGLDDTGRIDFVNPYFVEVSGYDRAESIGRRFADLVPEDERPEVEACVWDSLAGVAQSHVVRSLRTAAGHRRTIRWTNVTLRDASGGGGGVLRVGADVTEQRAAEAARDEAIRELEEFRRQLEEENVFLRQELEVSHGFSDIVGESDTLKYVLHRVEQVAETDTTVLVEGETGVGKELIARAIHRRSSRSTRPFITVDCGSLPANLVESELFGHEKGAFTGATTLRKGRFELADGGTIFLDEVGDLPLDLQVKLLRVLQEGEFSRIGSSRLRSVDVRVIAATHRSLQEEVGAGRFREDLFYRLHVYPITVPPLRERRADIPLLVHHFVRRLSPAIGREIESVPGPTMRRLSEYEWPGNVRELENVLERSVILSTGATLTLPAEFGDPGPTAIHPAADLSQPLAVVEREHIRAVLEDTGWRVEGDDGAAVRLGLKPSTLRSRMKKHSINRES
jgi:PAS domain S-box-containing protein